MSKHPQTHPADALTPNDWIEIYYAIDHKLRSSTVCGSGLIGWTQHLEHILEVIGPDGCNMWREK